MHVVFLTELPGVLTLARYLLMIHLNCRNGECALQTISQGVGRKEEEGGGGDSRACSIDNGNSNISVSFLYRSKGLGYIHDSSLSDANRNEETLCSFYQVNLIKYSNLRL